MVNRDEEEVLDRVDVDLDKYRKKHRSNSHHYSCGNQSDSSESGEVREDRSKHRSERRDKYGEQKEDGEIREGKDIRARGENNKDLTNGGGDDSRRHEREELRESRHRGHLRDGKSSGREKDRRLEDEGRRHNYSSENQSDSLEPGEVSREDRSKHRSERRDKYREQKEDGEIRESKDSRARGEGNKDLTGEDRDERRRHEREERRESHHLSHRRDGKSSGREKDGRLEDESRRHDGSRRSKADVDGRDRYENGQRQRQAESSRDKNRDGGLPEESGDDDGRDTEIRRMRERHLRRNVDPDDSGERKREREKQKERERNGRDDDRHDRRPRSDYDDKSHKRRDERRDDQVHGRGKSTKETNEKEGDRKRLDDSISHKPSTLQDGNPNGDTTNLGRSGGVYIPPFKLARMMKDVEDKNSVEYQRLTWDALRKSINGLVNKVNATNIKNIIPELFAENLVRGRGLFCRSCMKSQMASPGFTDVFAALVAVVNTKFPEVGDLLLRRIVLQLKRAYKRNDKPQLLAAVKFIAHLVNQQVAHEIIALELLTLLLENPTDDSVEVAVGFVTECGSLLQDLSPQGIHGECASGSR
ncbi:pre-mRNA-splicing factor CWC22 homolog [Macadamia integrifolia]|uniref:pre-mRNA-splicing factor CWC22 homolog n=1 Tax=Macadamia integrifolia TaxID=60698 RepID=UPI001C4F9859|nr:pre-mRNA-splicing factor CWC22 homolog [Macadamia integrifolia]